MSLFHFLNLGCSKNIVDGENIIAFMESIGMTYTDTPLRADAIIVNTCAFINDAKKEAVDEILKMALYKSKGNCKTLAVAGCFSQRYREQASRSLPEVDLWIGLTDWKNEIKRYFGILDHRDNNFIRHLTGPTATQYLKIAEGCSHRCSFCAIPLIRGTYRSRTVASVISEAKWLESRGVRECILVSQDTSYYGRDIGTDIVRLLEKLLASTSFPWIRLMYLHPRYVTRDLIKLISLENRICPYFDMPLQHSSDFILDKMRRNPGYHGIRQLIDDIRSTVPNAALRTTFIVGFPGETETYFKHLVKFVEWARFEKMGVFAYSPEEGTESIGFSGRPKSSTAQKRCETLIEIQREISRSILSSLKGDIIPAIIDKAVSKSTPHTCLARTMCDAPDVDGTLTIRRCNANAGDIIPVRITASSDYDLSGIPAS
jgi:ribosomal protein S12 methylthiotransferase